MTTAVLYARLSAVGNDPDNIPDQLAKARAYAEAQGFEVIGEYRDDETSAFSGKKREQYADMIDLVLKGGVDVIVARHQDRLMRNIETFGRLLNFSRKGTPLRAEFYAGGGYDFGTAAGGFQGGLQTLVGWYESAVKGERVSAAIDRNRRKGKRVGGGPRWFGYQYVYDRPDLPAFEIGEDGKKRYTGRRVIDIVLDEIEAPLIQDAAKRVLRGESLRSIADEWNANGITKVKGKPWTGGAVSQLLESPHLAALVHWKGEVFPAEWPAVLDRRTHERLVTFLHNPGRKSAQPGSGKRKHLLAGLLFCSSCGGRLVCAVPQDPAAERKGSIGNVGSRGGRGRGRSYICRRDLNPECGGRVRIDADSLEQFVIGHVVDLWTGEKVTKAARADVDLHDQLVALADQIAGLKRDLDDAYDDLRVHKIIDRDRYMKTKATIEAKIDKASKERDALTKRSGLVDLPDPSTGWDRLTESERRLLLEMLTPQITIDPFPAGFSMRPFKDPAKEAQRLASVLDKRVRFTD